MAGRLARGYAICFYQRKIFTGRNRCSIAFRSNIIVLSIKQARDQYYSPIGPRDQCYSPIGRRIICRATTQQKIDPNLV